MQPQVITQEDGSMVVQVTPIVTPITYTMEQIQQGIDKENNIIATAQKTIEVATASLATWQSYQDTVTTYVQDNPTQETAQQVQA